ncbi:MAG: M23 family metallopeptidase [Pyrinomonadaceae bacterium]
MQYMKRLVQILRKTLLIFYLVLIHSFAVLFVYQAFVEPYFPYEEIKVENVQDPTEKVAVPTPLPIPSLAETAPPIESNTNQNQSNTATSDSDKTLMIPVVGLKAEQLQDTYTASRSEGRVHNAIDIIAPLATPVVAVSDGEIAKFFDSERGGITIYQFSPDKRFVYYYAHLQKRADNLREHDFVKKGTVIGYVGDTGNSGAGNYHLHFEIMILEDPNKYWKGTDINPYPILKNGIESH